MPYLLLSIACQGKVLWYRFSSTVDATKAKKLFQYKSPTVIVLICYGHLIFISKLNSLTCKNNWSMHLGKVQHSMCEIFPMSSILADRSEYEPENEKWLFKCVGTSILHQQHALSGMLWLKSGLLSSLGKWFWFWFCFLGGRGLV